MKSRFWLISITFHNTVLKKTVLPNPSYTTYLKDALVEGVVGVAWKIALASSSTDVPSKDDAFCALPGLPNWNLLPVAAVNQRITKSHYCTLEFSLYTLHTCNDAINLIS